MILREKEIDRFGGCLLWQSSMLFIVKDLIAASTNDLYQSYRYNKYIYIIFHIESVKQILITFSHGLYHSIIPSTRFPIQLNRFLFKKGTPRLFEFILFSVFFFHINCNINSLPISQYFYYVFRIGTTSLLSVFSTFRPLSQRMDNVKLHPR